MWVSVMGELERQLLEGDPTPVPKPSQITPTCALRLTDYAANTKTRSPSTTCNFHCCATHEHHTRVKTLDAASTLASV
jgi:hypothetical protein